MASLAFLAIEPGSPAQALPLSNLPPAIAMSDHAFPSFQLDARGFVHVPPRQAWQVLTDYEHLPAFVPDLLRSKVLSRGPQEATIEQVSRAGFLFVSHTVHMVLHVEERPFSAIDVTLVSGDLRYYRAHWALAETTRQGESGTLITYSGELAPKFYLPPLIAQPLAQAQVHRMVAAVISEIEARGRQR